MGVGCREGGETEYRCFRVFSTDSTLHAAINHVITVLEQWILVYVPYTIRTHVRLQRSNTEIT